MVFFYPFSCPTPTPQNKHVMMVVLLNMTIVYISFCFKIVSAVLSIRLTSRGPPKSGGPCNLLGGGCVAGSDLAIGIVGHWPRTHGYLGPH